MSPETSPHLKNYYEKEAKLTDMEERMYSTHFGRERFSKVMEIIQRLDFKSFLDVGCGGGRYLINGAVGVDISKGYLHQAKIRASKKSLLIDLFQAEVTILPFSSNSFDLVLCSEVLEHVPDWQAALEELVRVACKYVLITVPGHTIFSIFQRDKSKGFDEYGRGHLHDITPDLILRFLSRMNMQVDIEEVHVFTHVPPQLGFLRFLDGAFRFIFSRWGLNQIVLLKKPTEPD